MREESYGPVVTTPGERGYIGAEVGTNNTGELSAMVEALRWVLHAEEARRFGAAVVWYDSEYAYGQVSGVNRARKNVLLVQYARLLRSRVERIAEVSFQHVKGHSGDPGNEAADRAAGLGASGQERRGVGWDRWPREMRLPRPKVSFDLAAPMTPETATPSESTTSGGRESNGRRRRRGGWRDGIGGVLALVWNAGRLLGEGSSAVVKRAALQSAVEETSPRLLVVVETWADGSHGDADMRIPGYDLIRLDRERRGGGGVALWIRTGEQFRAEERYSTPGLEAISVAVTSLELGVVAMYHPPGARVTVTDGKRLRGWLRSGPKRHLVVGDTNMNMRNGTPPRPRALADPLEEAGLQQRVLFVTRGAAGTIIDHVWTDLDRVACTPYPAMDGLSDHRMVVVRAAAAVGGAPENRWERGPRPWRKVDVPTLLLSVVGSGLARTEAQAAVPRELSSLHAEWDRAWGQAKRELAPRPWRKKAKVQARHPWVSAQVVAMLHRRRRLYRKLRGRLATPQQTEALASLQRECRKRVAELRQQYFARRRGDLQEGISSRKGWEFINELLGREGKTAAAPQCSPDEMNAKFIAKPQRLQAAVVAAVAAKRGCEEPEARRQLEEEPTGVLSPGEMWGFRVVAVDDVWRAARGAAVTWSPGDDEIPMATLRAAVMEEKRAVLAEELDRDGPLLAGWIAELANAVMAAAEWPARWKRAVVVPVWKRKGARADPDVYRPIALLTAVSRLVERLVAVQIRARMQDVKALPRSQFGFRPAHDTTAAMATLVRAIAAGMENRKEVLVASLDVAAAFDTVSHARLALKLRELLGLRGQALALMESYLAGRSQVTRLPRGRSTEVPLACGVPQGSVLGPVLYVLYTADVERWVRSAAVVQYADDITLVVTEPTTQGAVEQMTAAMAEYAEYAERNLLSPAPAKTQLLRCVSWQRARTTPTELMAPVTMSGVVIPFATEARILGLQVDAELSWVEHAKRTRRKASCAARAVARVRKHVRPEDAELMSRQLAVPITDYCLSVYGGGGEEARRTAGAAYRAAARAATGAERSADALAMLAWPEWSDRIDLEREKVVDRVLTRKEPAEMYEALPIRSRTGPEPEEARVRTRGETAASRYQPGACPPARTAVGEQRFERWAYFALTRLARKERESKLEEGRRGRCRAQGGRGKGRTRAGATPEHTQERPRADTDTD